MTHRGAPQFALRFPDEAMRDRIKARAEANRRSMNAEILSMLEACECQQVPEGKAVMLVDISHQSGGTQ